MLSSIWKTLLAFVGTFLTNLLVNWANTNYAIPTTEKAWATLVVTTLVVTAGVYFKGNTTTDPEKARTQSVTLKAATPGVAP